MNLFERIIPLSIEASETSGSALQYLGETNIINVLIVIALALFIYKSKGMSITRGLDSKISETVTDVKNAEMIQSTIAMQLTTIEKELNNVDKDRNSRIKAAQERGTVYAKRLDQTTQTKMRVMSDQVQESQKLQRQKLEHDILTEIAEALKISTSRSLSTELSHERHEALIISQLKEIEDLYWEECRTTKREVATL